MASFETAYKKTMGHEGGYSNRATDAGGETYKGISRRFNPSWRGWRIIDKAKSNKSHFPECLDEEKYSLLHDMVRNFFRRRYWDVYEADEMGPAFQPIANELFDTGVNMGVQRAILFLQQSINILVYRKGVISTEVLVEDGLFGPKTFKALTTMNQKFIPILYKLMNIMQADHYLKYIEKDNRQAEYLLGWLNRVEMAKA